jgi:glutamine synthetase
MAVNPHLALAMTTAASLAGIEQRLDAGQPMEKPLYDVTPAEQQERGIRRLPRTLIEAIEAFDADPLAKDVLGETMHGMFSQYKHDEWERFHQTVTEWDQKEYMKFF